MAYEEANMGYYTIEVLERPALFMYRFFHSVNNILAQ